MNDQPSPSKRTSAEPLASPFGKVTRLRAGQVPGAAIRVPPGLRMLNGEPQDWHKGGRRGGMPSGEPRSRMPHPGDRDSPKTDGVPSRPEPPRRRVPDDDIIDVGPRPRRAAAGEPVDVRELAYPAPVPLVTAAGSRARTARQGHLTKPLLALLFLELAVVSGVYAMQRYAESQAIVVPVPASERTIIT